MGIINKLIPIVDINLGTKKLFYSSQTIKINNNGKINQYEGKLKSEGGIVRSFSLFDFKTSLSVASNVSIINKERLQDVFLNNPESFTSVKLSYLYNDDTTAKIDEITGIASNPKWDQYNFSFNVKDSQKLYFKNVPSVIFDEKTFQISFILNDATAYTQTIAVGNPSTSPGGSKNVTIIKNLVSSSFGGKSENFWKGSRVDVIMDTRPSDHTDQASGHFAVVVRSADTTVFFNTMLEKFLVRDDETALAVLNNTMMSDESFYQVRTLTFQCVKDAVPQNSDTIGTPVPIIYGSPEKVPMVWAVGQKSTRTNSFGVGDDIYLFASHRCKLGMLPDSTIFSGLTATGANNGVYNYSPDSFVNPGKDQIQIIDALRTEVYWSLEDKRVVDAKISPGNKNWIPNPFPKKWPRSGNNPNNLFRDHIIRLISPVHRIKIMQTLRGEIVHAIQLRGGELDWFDVTYPIEHRSQYPIRYGMGNSKLYISTDGIEDDIDGFYTGHIKSQTPLNSFGVFENYENAKQSTLIKNPADILLHFIINYTSANGDKNVVDLESFRKSRSILDNWRFDTAINEIINGEQLIDRFCQQCCSIIYMNNGKFKMKTIIPSLLFPKAYIREGEHIYKQNFEFTKTEDIYNDFNFAYNYDYVNKKFSNIIKRNRKNDNLCRNSYAVNGFEKSKPLIEFRDINDESTAHKLADILIDLYSKRRVYMDCELIYNNEVIDANLEIGDCILVTSNQAPNGWEEKKCIILETRKYTDHMELTLMEI